MRWEKKKKKTTNANLIHHNLIKPFKGETLATIQMKLSTKKKTNTVHLFLQTRKTIFQVEQIDRVHFGVKN